LKKISKKFKTFQNKILKKPSKSEKVKKFIILKKVQKLEKVGNSRKRYGEVFN
jgi:hypothetical protein